MEGGASKSGSTGPLRKERAGAVMLEKIPALGADWGSGQMLKRNETFSLWEQGGET